MRCPRKIEIKYYYCGMSEHMGKHRTYEDAMYCLNKQEEKRKKAEERAEKEEKRSEIDLNMKKMYDETKNYSLVGKEFGVSGDRVRQRINRECRRRKYLKNEAIRYDSYLASHDVSLQEEHEDKYFYIEQEINLQLGITDKVYIDSLGISTRARDGLKKANIFYVSQLVNTSKKKLLSVKKIGKITLQQIEAALEKYGLGLKD